LAAGRLGRRGGDGFGAALAKVTADDFVARSGRRLAIAGAVPRRFSFWQGKARARPLSCARRASVWALPSI